MGSDRKDAETETGWVKGKTSLGENMVWKDMGQTHTSRQRTVFQGTT